MAEGRLDNTTLRLGREPLQSPPRLSGDYAQDQVMFQSWMQQVYASLRDSGMADPAYQLAKVGIDPAALPDPGLTTIGRAQETANLAHEQIKLLRETINGKADSSTLTTELAKKADLAGANFTGGVSVPAGFAVGQQGGVEGGEIVLAKGETSGLAGDVRIDVANKTLRVIGGDGNVYLLDLTTPTGTLYHTGNAGALAKTADVYSKVQIDEPNFRLGKSFSYGVTDWNAAVNSGWYHGLNAANQPPGGSGHWIGSVIAHDPGAWVIQEVQSLTETVDQTLAYRRKMLGSVWGAWERVYKGDAEKANVFGVSGGNVAQLSSTHSNRLSVDFVAKGSRALGAVQAAFYANAACWCYLKYIIYNLSLSGAPIHYESPEIPMTQGTGNNWYTAPMVLPFVFNNLTPGQTYRIWIWVRTDATTAVAYPANMYITGATL